MKCDLCNKEMVSFTHIVTDEGIMIVCYGCRDKEEVKTDNEYERQKEEVEL